MSYSSDDNELKYENKRLLKKIKKLKEEMEEAQNEHDAELDKKQKKIKEWKKKYFHAINDRRSSSDSDSDKKTEIIKLEKIVKKLQADLTDQNEKEKRLYSKNQQLEEKLAEANYTNKKNNEKIEKLQREQTDNSSEVEISDLKNQIRRLESKLDMQQLEYDQMVCKKNAIQEELDGLRRD